MVLSYSSDEKYGASAAISSSNSHQSTFHCTTAIMRGSESTAVVNDLLACSCAVIVL